MREQKKREAKEVQCDYCNKEFLKAKRFIKEGRNDFCNKECSSLYSRNRVKLECNFCNKEFEVPKNRLNKSKSGYYFCSRICKDKAQQIKYSFKEMWPSHYGKSDGKGRYRKNALNNYEHKCEICNYSEHKELLHVHHLDHNRKHNNIKNLMILCPTCHWSITMKLAIIEDRKYKWIK